MPADIDQSIQLQVTRLADLLASQNHRLLTAESCTGGWFAKVLTDQAGSSAWYEGGVVSYSNILKQRLLGVPAQLIQQYGAVSAEVAHAMAVNARQQYNVDYTLAITGIAGPGGGSIQKPVGTVFMAVASQLNVNVQQQLFAGDREAVRSGAIQHALIMLIQSIVTLKDQ